MSQADQEKWDARYAKQGDADASAASELLIQALDLQRGPGDKRGKALDLACGGGRNSLWLAQQGFEVDAVDVSAEGIALARRRAARGNAGNADRAGDTPEPGQIRWIQADLDSGLPVTGRYDLILMIRYLDLALLEQAAQHLNPGGMMVVELHMDPGDEPDVAGPRNPNFLVPSGALAAATSGLETLLLEEGIVQTGPDRREALARYIGIRAS